MNFFEWQNSIIGKSIDIDKVSGHQCVDVIHSYLKECYNIPVTARGNAVDYWKAYDRDTKLQQNFYKIKNTPELEFQIGDIVIWNMYPYGHIAVATGRGDTSLFTSIDGNWGNKIVTIVEHNFKNVVGCLRPKNLSKILYLKPKTYKLLENVGVYQKLNDGTHRLKLKKDLTKDGKKHALKSSNYAYLEKGTKVSVKRTYLDSAFNLWAVIPSGDILVCHSTINKLRVQ